MKTVTFLTDIVQELTGHQPKVTETKDSYGSIIDIYVEGNVSQLIGKEGKTIEAIRTIAKAVGVDGSHRVKVRINENSDIPSQA